jgi:sulfatase modifying factor 1
MTHPNSHLSVFRNRASRPGRIGSVYNGMLLCWLLFSLQIAYSQTSEADSCLSEPAGQVWINGADFIMGEHPLYPDEGPARSVSVEGFWIDAHEVTNAQFAAFVEATGYQTMAERAPEVQDWLAGQPEELGLPGSVMFTPPNATTNDATWWSWVPGTTWRQPHGPGSDLKGKALYPVVHIAYEDAEAYATWAGRSLPTEAQFELAARGGRTTIFPWGSNQLAPKGQHHANTWQGHFPSYNSAEDGYEGLAPVGCFGANDFGAYDLIGNVWEWTSDWYSSMHALERSDHPNKPSNSLDPDTTIRQTPRKVIKGGSYLCAENYCLRFRPAAREAQETGLGMSHIGFRTVAN